MNSKQTTMASDPKEIIHIDLNILRDYAERLLLREEQDVVFDEIKEEFRIEFWKTCELVGLTERDRTFLVLKGIADRTVKFNA